MGNDAELRERVAVLEAGLKTLTETVAARGKVKRATPLAIAQAIAVVIVALATGGVSFSLGRAEQATAAVQAKVEAYAPPPVVGEGSGLE